MGDPRRLKKKYQTPSHPWQKERLDEEEAIRKAYGTRNKKEIWRMTSYYKKLLIRAKKAVSTHTEQGRIEKQHLLQKVATLGLLSENATVDDILNLTLHDIFKRRLQTIIVDKKMAHTVKQARQFIVHGHIQINGVKVTSPSYLVPLDEEDTISFSDSSALSSTEHPEIVKLTEKGTAKEKAEIAELKAKEIDATKETAQEGAASKTKKEVSEKVKTAEAPKIVKEEVKN